MSAQNARIASVVKPLLQGTLRGTFRWTICSDLAEVPIGVANLDTRDPAAGAACRDSKVAMLAAGHPWANHYDAIQSRAVAARCSIHSLRSAAR